MEVGRTFESFSELEVALGELRKNGCHPLRVFNSQTAIDYNKKGTQHKKIHWNRWTRRSFRTRITVLDVYTTGKQGIAVKDQRSFAMGCPVKVTVSYDRFYVLSVYA